MNGPSQNLVIHT